MNFDGYDYHIIQKYRLAIAIAIVKNTPENLTPKTYFENLRNQIASKMETFDPDMTICEDDFDYNDNDECINNDKIQVINDNELNDSQINDSVTILKDFDFDEMMRNRNDDGIGNNSVSDVLRILKYANNEELEVALSNESNLNHTQSTYYESSQNATQKSTSAINTETQTKTHTKINSDTNINPKSINQFVIPKCNMNTGPSDDTYYDSQKSVLYTLHGFTDFTHVSQSQVEDIVIPKHLINRATIDNERNKVPFDNKNIKTESGLKVSDGINKVLTDSVNLEPSYKVTNDEHNNLVGRDNKYPEGNENNNLIGRHDKYNVFSEGSNVGVRINNFSEYNEKVTKEKENSQSSKKEVVHNFSNSKVNSKENNFSEDSKFGVENNFGKNNKRNKQNKFNTIQINTHIDKELRIDQKSNISLSNLSEGRNISQVKTIKEVNLEQTNSKHKYENNIDNIEVKRPRHESSTIIDSDIAYFNEIRSKIDKEKCFSNFDTDLSHNSNLGVNKIVRNYGKFDENSNTVNFDNFGSQHSKSDKDEIMNKLVDSQNLTQFSMDENSNNFDKTQNRQSDKNEIMNKFSDDSQNLTQFSVNENNWGNTQNVENYIDQEEMFDNITVSQAEVVPFKVLEELSRIKGFLNKREKQYTDGVTDSGYKSDSQSRSTFKSALQSTNWLNQSAHTLLTYLAQCPLIIKTADISQEISRTLGQLIDKLHEEENYPSFLEEHLSTVDDILKDIYENDVSDNILLKKDENIHRLFLLNRSSHIIKYTIEKILLILENAHTKLKSEEIFEINSVHEIENLSYIFHILEILLKRILIFKNISSQSTQSSQDEGILKKSSLTDIWRKKWNAKSSKFESDSNVGYPKKCVLDQCGVILNKIIVQAMDGYSLISFYALQCFNLLQN